MSDQLALPNIPVPKTRKQRCTHEAYRAEVSQRYTSCSTFKDAMANWHAFEEHRETCQKWLAHFVADPLLEINGHAHNPSGSISEMAWLMQGAVQPDRYCLAPFLDFEEHYQKCFLRRGLIIYLKLLMEELE
jgi:hypothetical protein